MRFLKNFVFAFKSKAPLRTPYRVAGLIIPMIAVGVAICVSLGAVILPDWPLFNQITLASLEWFPRFKLEMTRLMAMGAAEEAITLRRSLWQIYVAALIANMIVQLVLLPFAKIDTAALLSNLELIKKHLYIEPRVLFFCIPIISAAALGDLSFATEATDIGKPRTSGLGIDNLAMYFFSGFVAQFFFCISLTVLFALWKAGLLKRTPKA